MIVRAQAWFCLAEPDGRYKIRAIRLRPKHQYELAQWTTTRNTDREASDG